MPDGLPKALAEGQPLTALAPMQDVTDLAFMRVVAHYGAPDYFFTEFFRVHAQSRPERHILRSIDENTTETDVSILMALAADGYAGDNEIEAQAVDMMTEVWRVMRGIHQASDTLPGPIPPPPPPHTES